jgi:hypothetical protein
MPLSPITSWVLTARKREIGTDWVGIKTLYNSRYKIFFKTSFLPFSLKEVSKTTSDKTKEKPTKRHYTAGDVKIEEIFAILSRFLR